MALLFPGGVGSSGTTGTGGSQVNASGTASDSPVTIGNVSFSIGMMGVGTIENTHVSNAMTVTETVTDKYGTTDSVTTNVTAGNTYLLDLQTNFDTAFPPYVSYSVAVNNTSAGNNATYSLHLITLTIGSGGTPISPLAVSYLSKQNVNVVMGGLAAVAGLTAVVTLSAASDVTVTVSGSFAISGQPFSGTLGIEVDSVQYSWPCSSGSVGAGSDTFTSISGSQTMGFSLGAGAHTIKYLAGGANCTLLANATSPANLTILYTP